MNPVSDVLAVSAVNDVLAVVNYRLRDRAGDMAAPNFSF